MRDPDKFAWEVFCRISEPPKSNSSILGWEEWLSAFRLFADPTNFNFEGVRGQSVMFDDTGQGVNDKHVRQLNVLAKLRPSERISKVPPPWKVPAELEQMEDVALNPSAVNYVLKHGLISQEGQFAMAETGEAIDFPVDAVEIKTKWVKLTSTRQAQRYFYCRKAGDDVWGLESLHITTKDIPNWFWATFEHKFNYTYGETKFPTRDSWGYSNGKMTGKLCNLLRKHHLDSNVWSNYVLGGSQVDFTDSTGRPIVLGNNMLEGRLDGEPEKQSSCMTCHSRSTVGQGLSHDLPSSGTGVPKPSWFFEDDGITPKNIQRDFVWSLSRAKSLKKAPESVFVHIIPGANLCFQADIRPLFLDADIDYMKRVEKIDLTNWGEVTNDTNFEIIHDHYQHVRKPYLPLNRPMWSGYLMQQFEKWHSHPLLTPFGP